ncbi:ALG6 [Candida theae]|uniref:Alpha-1,3-glucosyltransferase n=1 Tax=Candida theae TaxID=1198502 RepID=A0AAD5BHD6_9ASCO|nr:ALG6 [Candida theae]KAI5962891.1 ALG6 [Candida theae]
MGKAKKKSDKQEKSTQSGFVQKATAGAATSSAAASPQLKSIFINSPVYDLLHYFEKAPDQWAARYILILSSIILRTVVGLGGHSGYRKPPMHGDFEAQRHWMELTINLPTSEWYFFDLQYWGLDYPPLTAYHSWVLGKIGSFLNPIWFALNSSRGLETNDLKFYMRITSIVSELVCYIPGILILANILGKKFNLTRMDQIIFALIILIQPHLVLIDHGHFQYNSVMLGCFVYAIIELVQNHLVMASVWFVSCINFKQMGLYYSVFIFFYILSQLRNIRDLISVGLSVIVTQFIYLLPFVSHWKTTLPQIVYRIFPFNRGLFEDKVANFWCTTNVLVKYRDLVSSSQLSRLALGATLIFIIPINIYIFYKLKKPTSTAGSETATDRKVVSVKGDSYSNSKSNDSDKKRVSAMLYGFAFNALSFYLFSYQVHEKSILLPLCPMLLLLLINPRDITFIQWVNNVGTFSLYPLLKKDDLVLQYFVTSILLNWLIGFRLVIPTLRELSASNLMILATYVAMIFYHVVDFAFDPPVKYPDLWVVLNIAISFAAFGCAWLWLILKIIRL